ncbi:MAG: polymer-forming cytoskeletal protein [Pseudomonadota bacterium]
MLSNFKKTDAEPAKAAPPQPVAQQVTAPKPPASAPTSARPSDRVAPSVIGSDLTIVGNLTSKGQVQIDGQVQGDILGTHIIIGERASITGGIRAEEVVVRGQVLGSIRGKRVMLQTQSHVEGDIFHQALAIEQGAFFEGKSRRSQDPLAVDGDGANPGSGPEVGAPIPAEASPKADVAVHPVPLPPTGTDAG